MNTRRNADQRLEEDISNVGAPPHGDQVPPLEEDVVDDQAPVNPPPLTGENIRADLLQMAQAITTQAQAANTQSQANREVVPRAHQNMLFLWFSILEMK